MAAGLTYTPIATTTLTSTATSYTISSIPSTYTDLILISNTTGSSVDASLAIRFNADANANYSSIRIVTDGTNIYNSIDSNALRALVGVVSTNTESVSVAHINNYASTTTYKTVISYGGKTSTYTCMQPSSWRSNSAISSMEIFITDGGTFNIGSQFTLYGIQAA